MGFIFLPFEKTSPILRQNRLFMCSGVLGKPPQGGKMTSTQKEKIHKLRLQFMSYSQIAKEVDLPLNTIKSYCFRNNLHTEALMNSGDRCKNCRKIITKKSKTRPRKFCGDACKRAWWNAHRYERSNENIIECTCVACGKTFRDYVKSNRKFCSLECYRERGAV